MSALGAPPGGGNLRPRLHRTNVWRKVTSPRTGAKRLRSGQLDHVGSFERRFARCYWMRSPHHSQNKDGRTVTMKLKMKNVENRG
jgi:hypothetical protein